MDIIKVGFIGCGEFAQNMHIPLILKNSKYKIVGLMDINIDVAKKVCDICQGKYYTDDVEKIFNDGTIDLVFITTRHDSHAELSIRAAKAKKHIMCEKPMALNYEDCIKVVKAVKENNVKYTIGYNRGLAPLITKAKELLKSETKKIMAYHRIQAPFPEEHWIHIKDIGGGRIIGEGCHIFDLFCRLTDSRPISVYASGGTFLNSDIIKTNDSANVTITFEDGSVCTTLICSVGCASFEKEVTEVYCNNKAIYMEGFKKIQYYGFEGHEKITMDIGEVDKGQRIELDLLADAIINNTYSPNGVDIALRAAVISYKVEQSIKENMPISISESELLIK